MSTVTAADARAIGKPLSVGDRHQQPHLCGLFADDSLPLAATICFTIALSPLPRLISMASVSPSLFPDLRQQHHLGAVVPSSNAIGLHFYPSAASLDGGCVGGPTLVCFHFLIGIAYMVVMELTAWACALDLRRYSAPLSAAMAVFLVYPFGQGSFRWHALGISGTFNFMLVFQGAQHPDAPLPHAGSRRCFRRQLVLRHGCSR